MIQLIAEAFFRTTTKSCMCIFLEIIQSRGIYVHISDVWITFMDELSIWHRKVAIICDYCHRIAIFALGMRSMQLFAGENDILQTKRISNINAPNIKLVVDFHEMNDFLMEESEKSVFSKKINASRRTRRRFSSSEQYWNRRLLKVQFKLRKMKEMETFRVNRKLFTNPVGWYISNNKVFP